MDDHSEKYASGKYVWGGAAACLVLLVALCARPEKSEPAPEKYAIECDLDCWNAKQLEKRREEMAEAYREGAE